MFKFVFGMNWEFRFGYFVGYGVIYYSYLYVDVLVDDIWKCYFEGDSFVVGVVESFCDKLLWYGGLRDLEKVIRDLLGKDLLIEVNGGFRLFI